MISPLVSLLERCMAALAGFFAAVYDAAPRWVRVNAGIAMLALALVFLGHVLVAVALFAAAHAVAIGVLFIAVGVLLASVGASYAIVRGRA